MYILIFIIYVVFGIMFKVASLNMNITGLSVDLILLVFQIIMTTIIIFLWNRRVDYKQVKENVTEASNQPLHERKTYMNVQHWIVIVLISQLSLNMLVENTTVFYIGSFIDYGLMFLLAYPLILESINSLKKFGMKNIVKWALIAFALSYATEIIINIAYDIFLNIPDSPGNQVEIVKLVTANPIRFFLDVVISAPILEEIVFRGLGFRTMIHRNRFLAYVVTFLIFGFVHMPTGLEQRGLIELVFLPIYGSTALFAAYAYEKTESIFAPMLMHAIGNLLGFIMILVF